MAVSHVQRRDSATGSIPSNTSSHMGSGMAANTNSKAGIVAKLLEALSAFAHVCKRRIPTVIAVVLLLAVWEAWVRIGQCAQHHDRPRQAKSHRPPSKHGRRYGLPRKSLCLKVPSDSCSPYCSAFSSAYCCTAHALRTPHCSRCFQLRRPCR